jgi:PAS domain S-box-containing protein
MTCSLRLVIHFLLCTQLLLFLLPFSLPAADSAKTASSTLFSQEEQQYLDKKKQITMCIDPAWLPLEAIVDKRHVGMTAEYMKLFSETIGIPIVLVPTKSWPQSISYAKERKCDIYSLAMPTPERETYMLFTSPYLSIPLVMAAKSKTPFIDNITTIIDQKIGMVKGYAFNELLQTRYPEMQIVNVASVNDGLEKVVQGEIFGFIGTLATVGYSIQKNFVGELKISGKFDERWSLGIGARNDEPLLADIFEKAIASIELSTQQEILNHWIAVRFEQRADYRLLWKIFPFVLAAILVLLYRNYTLGSYTRKLKQQNREIQQQAEQLRQTEEQLLFTQHAVETSVFPMVWVKHSHHLQNTAIIHANKAATSILGYNANDLVGRSIAEIDATVTEELWNEELGHMHENSFATVTSDFLRKDGSTFPVELFINYFQYNDEAYHFTFFIDISRQQEMEKKLHRSMKMEAVGLMAGGVAHDLNNILSGLITYPEIVLMRLPQDSPLREHITQIRNAGLRAAEVVADMLTVTRGTAATRKVESLNTLIEELLESAECQQILTGHKQLSCETFFARDLLNVSCSAMHIRKTILNLLFNAAEAVEGAGTIILRTENRYIEKPVAANQFMKPGEYVLLSISDNGSGISKEDQEHIFEPFYSKKIMGKSGTGLGLTIVKNTVQDHDGDITLKSDSTGTTFSLYLPATRAKTEQARQDDTTVNYYGSGERILVVDDEALQRDIACQLLSSLGYKTKSCASGEEAVSLIEKEPFDLVLLDMLMEPGINGRHCFEQMRVHKPDLKAIIVSGFSKNDEVKKALQQGVSSFIRKPYTLQQLGTEIDTILNATDKAFTPT